MPQLVHTLKSLSSVALLAVVKKGRPLVRRVSPEPRRLDHAAALRCGHLLILAGEIVLADRPADLLEHFGRLARGMQGLALLAAEGLLPEHPSNWRTSLSSGIAGRRATSHGSCAELFGCNRKGAPCDRQKVLKVVPILAWLPDPIARCCSLRRTDWESVPVHSIENVHRCQGSRRQLALSADRHHSRGVFL